MRVGLQKIIVFSIMQKIFPISSFLSRCFLFSTSTSRPCYYDWNESSNYARAVKEQYFLRDIITGYEHLKRQKLDSLNEDHLTFMAYVYCLFPQQKELFNDLKAGFNQLEEKEQMNNSTPKYIEYVRTISFSQNQIGFRKQLLNRINSLKNHNSLQSIRKVLMEVGYEDMGGMFPIFTAFKQLLSQLIIQTNYKIAHQKLNNIMQIHQYLLAYDKQLIHESFLMDLPNIYMQNEKTFQNMVQFLNLILSKNLIHMASRKDITAFHNRIKALTKYSSPQTKQILRKYSEHLAISSFESLVNFNQLLTR